MLPNLQSLLAPPVLERLTLVVNHVIGAEPAAVERLRAYAGHQLALELDRWPTLLPPAPPLAWTITPAGLLEWCGLAPPAQARLQVHVDARNPAQLLAGALLGERPTVRIDGDAHLAAEVGWLLQNLRWDVEADLERMFGPVVAHQVARLGSSLAAGLRGLARTPWMRPRSEADPPGPSPRA